MHLIVVGATAEKEVLGPACPGSVGPSGYATIFGGIARIRRIILKDCFKFSQFTILFS